MHPFATRQFILLVILAMVLFFLGLGRLPLLEPDEGRNAEVAREMLAGGDWITPHYNSLPYLDKPVVLFGLVGMSFRLWGISEWAARLPSAIMGLGTTLLIWLLARRMFGNGAGLRAGIVFATCPMVIVLSRLVVFDMTLACLVTLSMLSFWFAEVNGSRRARFDALAFAAMGVATLTKGPVGFLLPLLSLLTYQALRGRLGELKRLHWGLGLIVFLGATLPWFVVASLRNPDFPRYAFWEESLQRFATGRAHRPGGVFYYLPVYLVGLFPWSFFLPFAALGRAKQWRELKAEARKPIAYLLAWAGVVVVFFSISQSKLPAYFLPAAAPLSIGMGQVWAGRGSEERECPDWFKAGVASLVAFGFLLTAASQLFLFDAVRIRVANKVPPSLLGSIQFSMFYSGLIIAALAFVTRSLARRTRGTPYATMPFVVMSLTVPLLVVRWIAPLQAYANIFSSRQLARRLLLSPEKALPLYGYYYFRTSLPFYLRRPVGLVTADAGEMTSNYVAWRVRKLRHGSNPALPPPFGSLLIDASELRTCALSQGAPLLVMVRNTHVNELGQTLGRIEPRWNGWEYSVWRVSGRTSYASQSLPLPP